MRFRLASASLVALLALGSAARNAAAQAALDDDDDSSSTPATTSSSDEDTGPKTMVGVGLRLRDMIVPKGLIELFVEHANGGSSEPGLGIEVSRRKGDFEVQFAVEKDQIYVEPGLWVDKGDMIPQDEPDYVEFDKAGMFNFKSFGWVTAEVTFLNHSEITKWLSIRYGGGAGIALVTGHVYRTDYRCQTTDLDTEPGHCADYNGEHNHSAYDIPPVFLIVNAIVGVQFRPTDKVFINVEGGLHSAPFFGISGGAYF
jgi:hypothetical protein